MRPFTLVFAAFLTALAISSTYAGAAADRDVYLNVDGDVASPLTLSRIEFAKLPHITVRARDHDGKMHVFTGVNAAIVLQRAGAPLGEKLRGAEAREFVAAQGSDKYLAAFAFPEFTGQVILIADGEDGAPIANAGPLRLVVPGDATRSRWVRNLVDLRVESAH
jgi:DMSO/TMAO reductase YedYZ molybdopterin-dependent catalytic subunit